MLGFGLGNESRKVPYPGLNYSAIPGDPCELNDFSKRSTLLSLNIARMSTYCTIENTFSLRNFSNTFKI